MSNFIEYNEEVNIEDLINHGTVVLDFYGKTCSQCKMLGNSLEKIKDKLDDTVTVVRIDAAQYSNVSKEYGVMSLPLLIVYHDALVFKRIQGLRSSDALLAAINPNC